MGSAIRGILPIPEPPEPRRVSYFFFFVEIRANDCCFEHLFSAFPKVDPSDYSVDH
jgi:hypothetical protein